MYCERCRLHYFESKTGGRCPNCGAVGTHDESGGSGSHAPGPEGVPDPARTDFSRYEDDAAEPDTPAGDAPDASASRSEAPDVAIAEQSTRDPEELPQDPSPELDDATKTERPTKSGWSRGAIVAGKYEIIRKIGTGGFGSVFKVRHVHRKKLYALKTPHTEYLRDETFQKRFEREIEAMERFVHPDMVTVRDSGVTEAGVPYYTMDFIDGENLRDVMSREGSLDVRRAVNIVRRILEVLASAHDAGIVHRDIKPDNVLLTKDSGKEVVKVLDFGVAKILDPIGITKTITHGVRVGTPKYMSPEQVTGDDVDGRSDLFAVGILFYEALTGRHPFAVDRDPIRTTAAIISKEPEPPHGFAPDVSRAISDLVLELLEKEPRRRPESARKVLEMLPQLESTRSRSITANESLRFVEIGERRRVEALAFTRQTTMGLHRAFLFCKPEVTFGRSHDFKRDIRNDVLLRRLPCRSPLEDAENWNLNLTISHRAASMRVDRNAVLIEPGPAGIVVGGLRSRECVRIQSDRFHISVGDRALGIDGYRSLKDTTRRPLDLSFIPRLETNGERAEPITNGDVGASIGYSDPDCAINCVRLTRSDNHPLHSYFLVYRRLALGSGSGAEWRIDASGVEGHHASFIFDRGELFVIPVGGEVTVRAGAPSGESDGGGKDDVSGTWRGPSASVVLRSGDVAPITPGMSLTFGSVTLDVEEVSDDMFKRG